MRILVIITLLLMSLPALAQDAACDPKEQSCGCDPDWGCFELVYMAKGTVLGVKGTLTYVNEDGRDLPAGSFVTTYQTERYATRDGLALHLAASGTLGGGSAHTETGASGSVDFGYRGRMSTTGGPFLRAGMTGMWVNNMRFRLALFEPLQGRVGYQILDGDRLWEAGATQGLVALGSYRPAAGRRKLSEAIELGGYVTVHEGPFRMSASFAHFYPQATDSGGDLDLVRATYCDYRLAVTLCADLLYIRGDADLGDRADRLTHGAYGGVTIGLSP